MLWRIKLHLDELEEEEEEYVPASLLERLRAEKWRANYLDLSELFASAYVLHRAMSPVLLEARASITHISLAVNRIQDWDLIARGMTLAEHLEFLDVSNTEMRTNGLAKLVPVLISKKLCFKHLVAADNHIDGEAVPLLCQLFTTLCKLKIPHNQLGARGMHELLQEASRLGPSCTLLDLDLRNNCGVLTDSLELQTALRVLCSKQLTSISIDISQELLPCITEILQHVDKSVSLQHLQLGTFLHIDTGFIPMLRNLRSISLMNIKITDEVMQSLLAMLDAQDSVCELLDLYQNQLTANASRQLASFLLTARCPTIKWLGIGRNLEFGNEAANILARALSSPNCALRDTLTLFDNGIGEQGFLKLILALKHPSCSVSKLDFRFNDLLRIHSDSHLFEQLSIVHHNMDVARNCLAMRSAQAIQRGPLQGLPCEVIRLVAEFLCL